MFPRETRVGTTALPLETTAIKVATTTEVDITTTVAISTGAAWVTKTTATFLLLVETWVVATWEATVPKRR